MKVIQLKLNKRIMIYDLNKNQEIIFQVTTTIEHLASMDQTIFIYIILKQSFLIK
jgi:hypothetical protein